MSDTPRTDAIENEYEMFRCYGSHVIVHAKQLERELNIALKAADLASLGIDAMQRELSMANEMIQLLKGQLAEVLKDTPIK